MAPNTKKMQVKRYATRALIPSELGILEVTELKELISTRKSPTSRFNLVKDRSIKVTAKRAYFIDLIVG